jgi:hypothetical protein
MSSDHISAGSGCDLSPIVPLTRHGAVVSEYGESAEATEETGSPYRTPHDSGHRSPVTDRRATAELVVTLVLFGCSFPA